MLTKHILPRREKTDDANQFGTLCHWWKETGTWIGCFPTPLTRKAAEFVALLEKKLALSGTEDQRERWWPAAKGEHEVTFALNPFTCELKLFRGARDEADTWKRGVAFVANWFGQHWVTGTIDWLGKRGPVQRWHVDDLKTGAFPVDVETSKQLRTYALVPWLMDGRPSDWECDVSITRWPKYPLGGEPERTWHVLSAFDLEEHLQDLKWALANPQMVRPSDYAAEDGKLPHCAGCECREPQPGISGWVTHFWHRTLPHCAPGMMAMLRRKWRPDTDTTATE